MPMYAVRDSTVAGAQRQLVPCPGRPIAELLGPAVRPTSAGDSQTRDRLTRWINPGLAASASRNFTPRQKGERQARETGSTTV